MACLMYFILQRIETYEYECMYDFENDSCNIDDLNSYIKRMVGDLNTYIKRMAIVDRVTCLGIKLACKEG